jgi:oxygen-independent coproporphyrinogen III oxidase
MLQLTQSLKFYELCWKKVAGIYIHIPFCRKKCTYCDFHFSTNYENYQQQMVDSICFEIEQQKDFLNSQIIETIYFGGGTPSILEEHQLSKILETIYKNYHVKPEIECTLEVNPEDVTCEKTQAWVNQHVNRISVGIQSFENEQLRWMNRNHSAEDSIRSIKTIQDNGISNISIDLIYGVPKMDNLNWITQINKAISLEIPHISSYCLTVEEKTHLAFQVKNKLVFPVENDVQSEQFDLLMQQLELYGFEQYEISNFAKENFISQHNSNYWKNKTYLGVGPSAHSYDGKSRFWNISNNYKYMNLLSKNEKWFEQELLSSKNKFNEQLLTKIRTKWGINLDELNQIHPLAKEFYHKIKEFQNKNWILVNQNTLTLSQAGKHWADLISKELFS